ncbi:biliverdin-producing heme oxygenase [Marinobacterium sp. AK62]|uniref:Biliverdin-producing heme oxygenase n=1 Tax=Marinobacterium alkalitolerans TaxID=1542925 RepID=A0ABS3ZB81_9GAMM|nr:biliverdin-producing heme oxygenase [Marinobacterium alkalitolerans]MBP0048955.1 biliverdin-producing heme oxygenase [Marinobacterium alkalitolerans]
MDRALLKQSTSSLHEELDQHPVYTALMASELCPIAYTRALKALYKPQLSLENALLSKPDTALRPDRLSVYLKQDLSQLGEKPDTRGFSGLVFHSEPERLGALYVLEGSRLGARVIARHLAGSPQLPQTFYSNAASRSSVWPVLLGRLQELEQPADIQASISAARRVFLLYLKAADQVLQEDD